MRIALIAGESSGDYLGEGLIEALRRRHAQATFEGIAGPRMLRAGCTSLYPMERLSVMGLFESFGRYPELIPLRRRLIRRFIENPPDAFVGIDAPDFNLSIELALRRAGVPTVHYVSPSVWAWRRYRLRKIARAVDLMLTLFPFEQKFYVDAGVQARFVGHPLADRIDLQVDARAARCQLGLPQAGDIVALLPGSRMSEVTRLAEPMAAAAKWLARRRPQVEFVIPLSDAGARACFEAAAAGHGIRERCHVVEGRSRLVMSAADAVLLASGTATLEALLLKRPMVITYKVMPLSWHIARHIVHVKHVGLPNLLAGRFLVPEMLQAQAEPARLGAELLRLLELPGLRQRLNAEFGRIHELLRNDANERAADGVLSVIDHSLVGAPA